MWPRHLSSAMDAVFTIEERPHGRRVTTAHQPIDLREAASFEQRDNGTKRGIAARAHQRDGDIHFAGEKRQVFECDLSPMPVLDCVAVQSSLSGLIT
ncbi:hypothetical protein EAS62_20240 [Bradyrhizobium zhanjiangense]|uniref:Uncharacterized protein n=1 Tax=Bradyrhizobium zhanjiangense TaxID=1325107 RepID=A0ABY0DKA4_9BRAD|nr:hypothetical protein EAS62_20240 [Bradyrhizobium zhanjiangense]